MASDLNLNTVELTSTLRTAPLNGAPSSSDYNASARETLIDLAALANFINNLLLPLINALPDTALLPTDHPVGIEGRTIWTDTSDKTNLFFDALSSQPLTIADSIRLVNGIVTVLKQQLIDLGIEVASLQARLASTNQNDIALALQNLTAALDQLIVNQQIQNVQITTLEEGLVEIQVNGTDASSQNKLNLVSGSGVSIVDMGGGDIVINLYTGPAFTSANVSPNTLEVGDTISTAALTWTLNKVVSTLDFTAVDSHLTPSAPFSVAPATVGQNFTGSYTPTGVTTMTWTLRADDGTAHVDANFNVNFELKNYWGASTLTSFSGADILTLGSSAFATNRPRTITYDCTGGRYPVYAYPATYGDPASVTVGGFAFTDYSISTLSVTNAHGHTDSYKVLEFNNLQHGSAIVVAWN